MRSLIKYLYEVDEKTKKNLKSYIVPGITGGLTAAGLISLHYALKEKEKDFDHKKAINDIFKEKFSYIKDSKEKLNGE